MKPQYTRSETSQSVMDALDEFSSLGSESLDLDKWIRGKANSAGMAEFNLANDFLHIMFARQKRMRDRFIIVYIIAFCTDGGMKLAAAQVQFLFRCKAVSKMGYLSYFFHLLLSLPAGIRVFYMGRRMNKKWPFLNNWYMLPRSISSLREEYNIVDVVHI